MMFRKIFTKILLIICLGMSFPIYAEEYSYIVCDKGSGLSETFDNYNKAFVYYSKHLDDYDNLLLYKNEKLIMMEYGVVQFSKDDDYVEYHSILKNSDDFICSNYGVDGAYLYTKDDKIYFKVAGDSGYIDINNVTLIPYEELSVKISMYRCDDEYLYHNIKTQLDYEYYSSSLKIDFIPEFLAKNSDYFSYDGHYFYDNFYLMIDDYKSGTYENAINQAPYYNYYQYLPYRTVSNYSYLELEDYFYNTLGIDGKLVRYNDLNLDTAADEINRSQLYGEIDNFFVYQNIYGANALMLISNAINESSYGKSSNAFTYNNLYSTSAYDNELETEYERYTDIDSCIYAYAKYFVSNRFSNPNKSDYCGSFMGDRYSGITGTFNLDHYSGERLAATYFNIDSSLGLLDYNKYSIGIIDGSFNIYSDVDLNYKLSTIKNNTELAYVILDEYDDSYLIQLDACDDDDYYYDYESQYGYIDKDAVAYVINHGITCSDEFINVTYDFNGGTFIDKDSLVLKTLKGSVAANIEPSLSGYEFIGYDQTFNKLSDDVTYVAQYLEIKDISIVYLFEKEEELYPSIDLSKAILAVKYADGTSKKIAINTDMLAYFENSLGEHEVTVNYCGLSVTKTINIDDSVSSVYEEISEAIENNDYSTIKKNLGDVAYPFRMSSIEDIDYVLKNKNERNYVINDNIGDLDISISGLDLSLDDLSSLSFFKDTYYVEVDEINNNSLEKLESIAKGYGLQKVKGLNISFKFNFQNIDLNGPAIVQIDVPDKESDHIYSVYHLDENGDVIKCRTTHTNNYVQFIIYESGDYLLLSKKGVNEYNIEDGVGNLSLANVGYDNHRFNLNVLFITLLLLICFIGVIVYYIIKNKKEIEWKDYRKSLQKVDTAQEEKPKN